MIIQQKGYAAVFNVVLLTSDDYNNISVIKAGFVSFHIMKSLHFITAH